MTALITLHAAPGKPTQLLVKLVETMSGRGHYAIAEAQEVLQEMAKAALDTIHRDFLIKSVGGTGSDGIHWAPLHPSTIAKRTAEHDKRWQTIFVTKLTMLRAKFGLSQQEATARAERLATATMNSRNLPIGIDTGDLEGSLNVHDGNLFQIILAVPGKIRVGTNVYYAQYFHKKRRLWPEQQTADYLKPVQEAGQRHVDVVLPILVNAEPK
jgi:hypothetical protein